MLPAIKMLPAINAKMLPANKKQVWHLYKNSWPAITAADKALNLANEIFFILRTIEIFVQNAQRVKNVQTLFNIIKFQGTGFKIQTSAGSFENS